MNPTELFPPIPADTAKTVQAIFGSSNFYLTVGDQVNQLFRGLQLSGPEKPNHLPTRILAELYLITIFQYLETLPDGQAADAIRERRDWKYALHLPLNISGFQASMFCQFRKLLLGDRASQQTLQTLLARLAELGVSNGKSFHQDADRVILRVCLLSRIEKVWEAFSRALQALALKQADQLRAISRPYWYERYSQPKGILNLSAGRLELEQLAQAVGGDGFYLLEALQGQPELAGLPEITALRQALQANYQLVEAKVVWRKDTCANCSPVPGQTNTLEPA